ncbi:hypothetical protein PIB30_047289 [Stylosanthes scabra]|uniref:Uncharacterized protein n=1 Tax=Stylosanthes scabra TaxID=79078 RepID=A0ABU6VHP1_9FABA|nr:hypothetical protein [Stylosanthes scabra]
MDLQGKGGSSHVASFLVFPRMQSDVNDGSSQGQEINCGVQDGNQNTTFKRMLDFEVEEIAPNERFINISDILIPDFLAQGSREMLWSLRPGKELFDNFEPGCDDANNKKGDYQMVATNDFCKYLDGFLAADMFYEDESSIRLKPLEFEFIEPVSTNGYNDRFNFRDPSLTAMGGEQQGQLGRGYWPGAEERRLDIGGTRVSKLEIGRPSCDFVSGKFTQTMSLELY